MTAEEKATDYANMHCSSGSNPGEWSKVKHAWLSGYAEATGYSKCFSCERKNQTVKNYAVVIRIDEQEQLAVKPLCLRCRNKMKDTDLNCLKWKSEE